jgi:hypothetical protein
MAETTNISRMAERLTSEIFPEFGWQAFGPTNMNWNCSLSNIHERRTHPSDLVMWYEEPYFHRRTYINFDLKSYAKGSITTAEIGGAVKSLCQATECSRLSEDWQNLYIPRNVSWRSVGLLFVYNHDGEYDKEFYQLLQRIDKENYRLRPKTRIFILSPRDVCSLATISQDIRASRGSTQSPLPNSEYCSYFFPDLDRHKAARDWGHPAILEMLTSSWIIMQYKIRSENHVRIYYREKGTSTEEFLYLIDYIVHYQLLLYSSSISIRLVDPDNNGCANFERAIDEYARDCEASSEMSDRLTKIGVSSITMTQPRFSEIEIGMECR